MLIIWHNPRCSKSRQTLALLEESGLPHEVRRYLEEAPSLEEIKTVMAQLGLDDPRGMMRRGEVSYKTLGLKTVTAAESLLSVMAENPILIERPIVSNGKTAIIGRPPEAVKSLFG